jgi:chromosome segregation ATPase
MAKKTAGPKKSSSKTPDDVPAVVGQLVERRERDAAAIAALQEREQKQAEALARQEKRIEQLSAELAGVRDLLEQAGRVEELISNFKREFTSTLEEREEEWRGRRAQLDKARRSDLEVLAKQLRESLRYDEQLETRRADVKRLEQTLERLARQFASLKESRAAEAGRSATGEQADSSTMRRISELEQITQQLRGKLDAEKEKGSLLEEGVRKQLSETTQRLDELKRSVEDARVAEAEHHRRVAEFEQRLQELDRFMEEWRAHKELFDQQYQRARQLLDKLEALQAQLTSRQNEVAEMQRLAEERAKRDWEKWQASTQELLRSNQATAEEQYRIHGRRNQELKDGLDQLADQLERHEESISALIALQQAQLEHGREASDVLSRADRLLRSGRVSSRSKSE